VAKRSSAKESRGGRKGALRRHKRSGTAVEEVVYRTAPEPGAHDRTLTVPLLRGGEPVGAAATLEQGRQRLRDGLRSVPWEGLKLSRGEPAIPTTFLN